MELLFSSDKGSEKDSGRADQEHPKSILKYVLTDFLKGCYIFAALAIDVFLVFQIYVWLPNIYSAILTVLIIVVLGFLEYRLYFVVRRILNDEIEDEDVDY
jgi:hypothetical protein